MMPTKIIKYSQRLGDVLRCLPACKYLADQGHKVLFDCFEQYHGVFDLVSYVKPLDKMPYDADLIDLEIWPSRYGEFLKSKKSWHDFVYSHPEIKQAKRTDIVFDLLDSARVNELPPNYHLIAPFGISQTFKHNPLLLIQDASRRLGKEKIVVLCPPEIKIEGLRTFTAKKISDLVKAVRDADEFWAINSAPIIIASSVRRGKESKFWGEKDDAEVQNVFPFDGLYRMD